MPPKEPFPGDYRTVGKRRPQELEVAVEYGIPCETIEPWQVHYPPFVEKIIVLKGELLVQKPIWMQRDIERYGVGGIVRIPQYVPHRLINPVDQETTFVVESSPGPDHRLDLEPEFPSLNACLDELHRKLVENALRV